jgi:hypothetical protein
LPKGFQKGICPNPNGRPKGAINKEKKALRELITAFLENNYHLLEKNLLLLEGKEFIDRMIALLEYATPKLNRTDLSNDGEKFDFSNYNDHELISELRKLSESLQSGKAPDKQVN